MKKIAPDPPCLTLHDAAQRDAQSLDRAAADRALDFYLLTPKPPRPVGMPTYAIPDSVNVEAALAQRQTCCAARERRRVRRGRD